MITGLAGVAMSKDWYYRKWEEEVIEYLPKDITIQKIEPSVWNRDHVQAIYKQNGKIFCEQIPESELVKEQTK
jgi:AMMECR1 domain-containing protein